MSDQRPATARRRPGRAAAAVRRRRGLRPLRRGVGGRGRAGARPRRPVPDRVDHQDDDGGAGGAGPRRGAARPRRPARRAPAATSATATRRSATLLAHVVRDAERAGGPWWERTPGRRRRRPCPANDGSGRVAPAGTGTTTATSATPSSARSSPDGSGRRGGRWCPSGSSQPARHAGDVVPPASPYAQPGWSVAPLHRCPGPRAAHDTGAMAPAGQLWRTLDDLVTWGQVLGGARPDVLADVARSRRCGDPCTADYGLGLRLGMPYPGGRARRPHRLDAGLPGRPVRRPATAASGWRCSTNATTGHRPARPRPGAHRGDPTPRTPGRLRGARPSRSRRRRTSVLGYWHWGNSAYEVRWHNDGSRCGATWRAATSVTDQFELAQGTLVGVAGYHHGETLHVVRRADGSVSHLECATFVYTRSPTTPRSRSRAATLADGAGRQHALRHARHVEVGDPQRRRGRAGEVVVAPLAARSSARSRRRAVKRSSRSIGLSL